MSASRNPERRREETDWAMKEPHLRAVSKLFNLGAAWDQIDLNKVAAKERGILNSEKGNAGCMETLIKKGSGEKVIQASGVIE